MNDALSAVRTDFRVIADLVEPGTRVLDVGCGDGALLDLLMSEKNVDGRGIEIEPENVALCVARGLSVIQGDADSDLAGYPDQCFDYVILSQTLQATRAPRDVVQHMLRIGRKVIISIPNFGHYEVRLSLMVNGRMPVSEKLPYQWYDTPNIHFCTIADFVHLAKELHASVDRAVALDSAGTKMMVNLPWWIWNIFGQQAVFLLSRA